MHDGEGERKEMRLFCSAIDPCKKGGSSRLETRLEGPAQNWHLYRRMGKNRDNTRECRNT